MCGAVDGAAACPFKHNTVGTRLTAQRKAISTARPETCLPCAFDVALVLTGTACLVIVGQCQAMQVVVVNDETSVDHQYAHPETSVV